MEKISLEKFAEIKNYLDSSNTIDIKVVTGSMKPVIKVNEIVKVKKIDSLKMFDICIFRRTDGVLIAHFFFKQSLINENEVYFASLNPVVVDSPIEISQILGKVVNKKISLIYKIRFLWRILKL